MSSQKKRFPFHVFIAIPVAVAVLGAFVLSGAAVLENLRFVETANQVLSLVSQVRSIISQQKGFAQTIGDNVWADLVAAGQIDVATGHNNAWGGDERAVMAANLAMRVENDLPTRDCRRLGLYYIGRQPFELGLLSVEAQSFNDNQWVQIYPLPKGSYSRAAQIACGTANYARLALVFKVR